MLLIGKKTFSLENYHSAVTNHIKLDGDDRLTLVGEESKEQDLGLMEYTVRSP